MSNLTLNSWLVQSERSIHLKCPAGLNVSQEEYMDALIVSARELELPLELETCEVNWVDANLRQKRIRVKLQSNERYGLLTGLDYIGRVAFVEQKTYLDPVSLPAKEKIDYKFPIIVGAVGLAVGGGLCFVSILLSMFLSNMSYGSARQGLAVTMGCFSSLGYCFGPIIIIASLAIGAYLVSQASQQPEIKRRNALERWIKDVLDLARRAEISNELNRTAQALDEAVKVAVDRLFTQRGAQMESDEKKRRTANEIQIELENRKKQGL